jgi:hypothetical protein
MHSKEEFVFHLHEWKLETSCKLSRRFDDNGAKFQRSNVLSTLEEENGSVYIEYL